MFPLTITAVDKILFEGDVASVTCPGSAGELTVLAHHEAFITTLKKGEVRVRKELTAEAEIFEIEKGLLEVGNNRVTILI